MKPEKTKAPQPLRPGQQVRNRISDRVGVLRKIVVVEKRGYALVEFIPGSDGYLIPLSLVEPA
jgi:hypothetical protein